MSGDLNPIILNIGWVEYLRHSARHFAQSLSQSITCIQTTYSRHVLLILKKINFDWLVIIWLRRDYVCYSAATSGHGINKPVVLLWFPDPCIVGQTITARISFRRITFRDVYPYILMAQMRHFENGWLFAEIGDKFLKIFKKNISVIMYN